MENVTLREVYEDPAVQNSWRQLNFREIEPLENLLAVTDSLNYQQGLVASLEEIQEQDFQTANRLKDLVLSIPPETLFEKYGERVLVWGVANTHEYTIKQRLKFALHNLAGYDQDLLEKSRLWAWQKYSSNKTDDLLSQYAVMKELWAGGLDKIDLPGLLQNARKPGVELSAKRLADYALIPLRAEETKTRPSGPARRWYRETEPGVLYQIWLDAPTGFALTYKGKPNAVIALAATDSEDLLIHQLQGVRPYRVDPQKRYVKGEYVIGNKSARGLAPLDWQKLMVGISAELAKNLGLPHLGIQGGQNNWWTIHIPRGSTKPHLNAEAAAKAYDLPAQRLGFVKSIDDNWYKQVA